MKALAEWHKHQSHIRNCLAINCNNTTSESPGESLSPRMISDRFSMFLILAANAKSSDFLCVCVLASPYHSFSSPAHHPSPSQWCTVISEERRRCLTLDNAVGPARWWWWCARISIWLVVVYMSTVR